MQRTIFLLFLLSIAYSIGAQSNSKSFGIQFRPIFPLGITNTDGEQFQDDETSSTLKINVNSVK